MRNILSPSLGGGEEETQTTTPAGQSSSCGDEQWNAGGYVLVVYEPASPHEALPGPLELRGTRRQTHTHTHTD